MAMKYGLAKEQDAPYEELKEYGYDRKSAHKAGLKAAGYGAGIGGTIAGAPTAGLGIPVGMGIGAAVGYVGGFAYDMISGGDNLSHALSKYNLKEERKKLEKAQRKDELGFMKKAKEKRKRAKDLPAIAGDEMDREIMALGGGTSQYDRWNQDTFAVKPQYGVA